VGAVNADSLRLLLAVQPKLVTPVLQVVHRAITRFLLDQAGPSTLTAARSRWSSALVRPPI